MVGFLICIMKQNGSKIGILGYGEVWQVITQFYKNPTIKDLNHNNELELIDNKSNEKQ